MYYNELEFEKNVLLITESQRTPVWFMQCFGRRTGTTAGTVLRALGKQTHGRNEDQATIPRSCFFAMKLIGIRITGAAIQDDDAEDAEDRLYTAAELAPMTNAALKEICKSLHCTRRQ